MWHGRTGRPRYTLGVALSGIAALLVFAFGFAVAFGSDSRGLGYITWAAAVGLIAVPQLPLHVRRLHDVGLPGWWLLVPVALTGLLLVTVSMVRPDGLELTDAASWSVLIPYALACAAGFGWPGHQGSNRYGLAPHRSTTFTVVSGVAGAGLLLLAVATFTFFSS